MRLPRFTRCWVLSALTALLVCPWSGAAELYQEPFRPQFHFTPARNWMNDPNGMVYFAGEYHLFYQYNPQGNGWGHMSWGHAVSPDLVHWEHLPLAIPESDGVMIFSGSAVVDWGNTSGLGVDGQPPLVAIYTGAAEHHQDQRLAYSNDRGRTWTKYQANPVLDIHQADFRDPKVAWHEPTRRWIMTVALATAKKVEFYASTDLKSWNKTGDFGPAGATGGAWECPDLFPLPVEGEVGARKWVLTVNIGGGAPAGGSGCQYFVGEFDGARFVQDPTDVASLEHVPAGRVLADFEGRDYAGWIAEGSAFGSGPAPGTLPDQQPVSGFRGHGLVNTYLQGDKAQGTLTSPAFEIDADYLSFLIGGGAFTGQTCLDLRLDGKIVRTATGDENERLAWKSWDLREFRGRQATLQIVDRRTDGWGHINVDHVLLAAEPARSAPDTTLWADFGPDFYAAVTWGDVADADGRRLWLGWMSNWTYAGDVPTSPWRSAMTVPRALGLRRTPAGFRLVQSPVAELAKLRRGKPLQFLGGTFDEAAKWLAAQADLPALLELELTFTGITGQAPFALELHTGSDQSTILECDPGRSRLVVDRTRSGLANFHRSFAARHEAPIRIADGRLTIRLLLDTSSLELFAQGGETVMTESVFPTAGPRHFSLRSTGESTSPSVAEITIRELQAIWR